MPFRLTTHNYSITPDIQELLQERLGKLVHRARPIATDVYITKNTRHAKGEVFEVEVALHLPKKTLIATTKASEVPIAIRRVEEKLAKQLDRYKAIR